MCIMWRIACSNWATSSWILPKKKKWRLLYVKGSIFNSSSAEANLCVTPPNVVCSSTRKSDCLDHAMFVKDTRISKISARVDVKDIFPSLCRQQALQYLHKLSHGYAADGYACCKGIGCCVVTFTVGGLSVINAIAGAYSESFPLICIVDDPNSNDFGTNRILHHTIGIAYRCFQQVTCCQVIIQSLDDGHELIDRAISTALRESKPVYISVSCNLPGLTHPSFNLEPVPYAIIQRTSNPASLEAAVNAAAEFLNSAVKPVFVGGPKLRVAKVRAVFAELADGSGYAVSTMPSAKGEVIETHPHFIGTYWCAVSTPFCLEIVESADAYLFAGPIFNDYSSVGYSLLFTKENAVIVQLDRVTIGNGTAFGCVLMKEFLEALANKLKKNTK